jgi:lysophospholipase L1-like esterase
MRDARRIHQSWLWLAMLALAACSTEQDPLTASSGASAGIAGGATPSAGGASPSGGGTAGAGGTSGALATGGSDAGRGGLDGSSAASGASLGGASLGGATAGGAAAGAAANGGAPASAGSSGAYAAGAGGASAAASGAGGTSAGGTSAGGAGGGKGYQPCPTSPCAVLPLGDSITEGFGSSGAGYRVELFKQAVQNGKNLTFVGSLQNGPDTVQNVTFPKHHEGHDGYTIASGTGNSGISGAITDQAIANYHPNIVLLMIGTNDINGNVDVANAPSRLGSLIDDITTRAANALVVVATIIPIANAGTNQKVQTYNAALVGIVSARATAGKHVTLLDNYAAFAKVPNYATTIMYNYLHPNDAGYVVLGDSFYSAIGALLP